MITQQAVLVLMLGISFVLMVKSFTLNARMIVVVGLDPQLKK
jgi:hypothetical protein